MTRHLGLTGQLDPQQPENYFKPWNDIASLENTDYQARICKDMLPQNRPDQGSYKKLQLFFKDFSRATLDFQGTPTRNIISQIVHNCTFPVYFINKALRLELFASPASLHFSVHLS